jgi:hypothetical protein
MRRVVQAVLESRFGPLDDDVLAALAEANTQSLEALSVHAATGRQADMRTLLGLDE